MVRKLKHHEQKLLKKVDFLRSTSNSHRASQITRLYHLPTPETYHAYSRLAQSLKKLAHRLTLLPPEDPFRLTHEKLLLEKLYTMGILHQKSKMSEVENKVSVSAFCRRRLAVVMTRLRMAENVKAAVSFVEQGHVRVGPEVVTDPAYLVTRNMEDFVTWVDSSKIKRTVLKYRDEVDDYDLL
ncbi:hypothetical protein L211DRAFT_857747 [Terfezia boudieri ATCC MYA-4762]|uniref:U3 small nucleolar ribonucleoprotein protein IMP3 n=1 Tax=Terfezia boudieri ATCC MYA-4762 TaxID=1051890 RepID=A0A3N4LNW9_9PEZI|nr:hypothetical protein L211DRAFT_857747 [Terfezia boudieri ATCC MYA-4762]